ncbi:MAG TPA: hypothetical protein VNX18_00940 [Bryobacteraceae bacterium]|nr:hypothetical protein [Bryobacteraceae bacterium]
MRKRVWRMHHDAGTTLVDGGRRADPARKEIAEAPQALEPYL